MTEKKKKKKAEVKKKPVFMWRQDLAGFWLIGFPVSGDQSAQIVRNPDLIEMVKESFKEDKKDAI